MWVLLFAHCSYIYSKCSKISNTFLFLFTKIYVSYQGRHSQIVRIANRKGPDPTASSEAVGSESALFVNEFLAGN